MNIDLYRKQYDEIIQAEKALHQKKLELLDEVRGLAKYKPGDKVVWKGSICSVGSLVLVDPVCEGDPLSLCYDVGRVAVLRDSAEEIPHPRVIWDCVPEEELSDG